MLGTLAFRPFWVWREKPFRKLENLLSAFRAERAGGDLSAEPPGREIIFQTGYHGVCAETPPGDLPWWPHPFRVGCLNVEEAGGLPESGEIVPVPSWASPVCPHRGSNDVDAWRGGIEVF